MGQERLAEVAEGEKEEVGMTLSMKRLAVLVLAAFALCLLAVTVAVLLVPSLSWAGVLEWVTTTPPCEKPCD
jgi:hypothetical protein